MVTRRERLLAEGMRLFGERGYAATSVAQIEEAAGLSPGSGSLYKHFRSKEELLAAGLDRLLGASAERFARSFEPGGPEDVVGALEQAVREGFARMEEDRDLSRVLFRGLAEFPDMLARFGEEEVARIQRDSSRNLFALAARSQSPRASEVDWDAVAAVAQAAVAHYWLLEDVFGGVHPTGVSRERFGAALVGLVAAMLGSDGD